MLIHAVLFVVKQLNLFPVKGGLLSKLSPKQIMPGEVVQYKFCAMGLEGIDKSTKKTSHIIAGQRGRKVQFCSDPVGMPKGAISFRL